MNAMKNARIEIVYTHRGRIERGANYHWVDGYSATTPEGHVLYPWMSYRECQQDAKAKDATAAFFYPEAK